MQIFNIIVASATQLFALTNVGAVHMMSGSNVPQIIEQNATRARESRGAEISIVHEIAAAPRALARLRKFKGWTDNWDGEGSKAPNPAVLDSAGTILGLLAMHRVPSVALSAEGHPMFIYGAPIHGEVVVTGRDTFDYAFMSDDGPEHEGATLTNGSLPAELIKHLQSV